jgi:hypothetical protein
MADEYVRLLYRKEEDFLEHFLGTVEALLPVLAAEHSADWRPSYACDDAERWARDCRLPAGQLDTLTFDKAVIFHGRDDAGHSSFSSLQTGSIASAPWPTPCARQPLSARRRDQSACAAPSRPRRDTDWLSCLGRPRGRISFPDR